MSVRLTFVALGLATITLGLIVHLYGAPLGPTWRDVLGDIIWAANGKRCTIKPNQGQRSMKDYPQEPDRLAREAAIPNPKLHAFQQIIGMWTTVGTHPMVPGTTFHGRTSFEWQDGGAFLVMRSEIDEPEIPSGIAIISGDDASDVLTMLYFDERGVSRRYDTAIEGNVVRWWRSSPEISQRCAVTISDDGKTMQTNAELSKNNGPWERDLELSYTRVK